MDHSTRIISQVRDRLTERAMSGAPLWHAPMTPAARNNAGSLIVGTLLGKLPAEDSSALVETIVAEQRTDGSWSSTENRRPDLSATLEIVGALSLAQNSAAHESLTRAIGWIEQHREIEHPSEESLALLATLTDNLSTRWRRHTHLLARRLRFAHSSARHQAMVATTMRWAVEALWGSPVQAKPVVSKLLARQRLDGSWEGSARSTVFAMAALRHAGLNPEDGAFERGWRYLRNQQVWGDQGLVQNPCDVSTLLHATAVRTLLVTGAEPDVVGGSTLSLLHHARPEGGWSLGADAPVDLLTTALTLDALSFAGDKPIETMWARRRAVMLLVSTQRPDGGWPMWPEQLWAVTRFLRHRSGVKIAEGSVDVTAAVLQALVYSGVTEPDITFTISRGVRFLLSRQDTTGLWRSDVMRSDVFATARAIEALMAADSDRAGSAILRAARAMVSRQRANGAWGDPMNGPEVPGTRTSPHHTAWALRALAGVPGIPQQSLMHGRVYLDTHLHPSEQLWTSATPGIPLPYHEPRVSLIDLTSLWGLEAYALLSPGYGAGGMAKRPLRTPHRRRA